MNDRQPDRLTNAEFMGQSSFFRIFKQCLHGEIALHWHEFYEVTFVLSGVGTHIFNGTSTTIQAGSIFLSTPSDFHEIKVAPDSCMTVFNVIFSEPMISDELYILLFHAQQDLWTDTSKEQAEKIAYEYELIWKEANHDCGAGSELLIKGALERILIMLARSCGTDFPSNALNKPDQDFPIRKAIAYIQHHFRDAISLEDAARQAGFSPNYFSERFRKVTGIPFQQFLKETRLAYAQRLLQVTKLPVTEICHASGFNTLPYFERSFKFCYGMSPRDFRKQRSS